MNSKEHREKSVKTYYNQFSNDYDNFYKPIQLAKFSELESKFTFTYSDWVIDVGGGTGLFSEWSNQICINLDISFDMLKYGLSMGRVFLAVACDIQAIPLRSNSCTSIYSFTAIQNCSDPNQAVIEIKRISRDNLVGIITILAKVYRDSIFSIISQLFVNSVKIELNTEDFAFLIHSTGSSFSSSGSKSS